MSQLPGIPRPTFRGDTRTVDGLQRSRVSFPAPAALASVSPCANSLASSFFRLARMEKASSPEVDAAISCEIKKVPIAGECVVLCVNQRPRCAKIARRIRVFRPEPT